MATTENTTFSKGVRGMLGLSLHAWEDIMALSLAAAAFAAAIVGVSTYCVIQLTRQANQESAKEIAEAKAALGAAQASISNAQARIAEADARAKEADLRLEQLRERMRPRQIKGASFLKILEGKPKAPVEILFVRDDGEAFQLSLQIRDFLKQATWSVEEPRHITQDDVSPRLERNHPYTMAAGGQPQGVSLFLRAENQADFEREADKNPLDPDRPLNTPRKALSAALLDSLGTLSGGMSYENGRPGVLRVIVGPKPQLN